ncbi:thermonuclease family protein [Sphingobacterium sp. CZ-2]|uniref:thermonuclease family protein n=1 Tax=Sphingobacterium sp. CZ-2 TaxID=2557994 RepID=UPI001ADC291F|nr:thermonuclease family protein [Sphingobacterium sp. CZ-2]
MIKRLINYTCIACLGLKIMISCTSMSAEYSKHREVQSEGLAFVSNEQEGIQKHTYYQVTKVVDGDTFWIDNLQPGGLKIRFIGIDAPESRNAFKKKKQFYGKESKEFLTALLKDQKVRLEFDVDSLDPFNRTLAYVYLENGEMVNELIVKSGNGILMTVAPNVKFEELFVKAQKYARENKLGLWAEN